MRKAAEMNEERNYAVKNEEGEVIAEFEASAETAATVVFLLTKAVETEREKVAKWMIENGFATGHGDLLENLLKQLTWQIAELRLKTAGSKEEIRAALRGLSREDLVKLGVV